MKTPMPPKRPLPMNLVAEGDRHSLKHIDDIADIAALGDADARGVPWYEDKSSDGKLDGIMESSASASRSVQPYPVRVIALYDIIFSLRFGLWTNHSLQKRFVSLSGTYT